MRLTVLLAFAAALCFATSATRADDAPPGFLDVLSLGSDASERAHELNADHGDVVRAGLDEPARRLLPGGGAPWEGGRLTFTMAVDPARQTYLTARFWGSEVDKNLLILFCDGKQVGYRHLGDVDVLALPDDDPRHPGRYYYVTTVLPPAMTAGKRSVKLELRATGPIWGYGNTFDQYQKPMTAPSRAVFRLYTHADGYFVPPADEKQGTAAPPVATRRPVPGPEVMDAVKARVDDVLGRMTKSSKPLNQMEVQFLARAYHVKWTVAHENPFAAAQVVKGVDALYARWKADPAELWKDKATWNPEWFGVGPAGDAVRLLPGDKLAPLLEEKLDGDLTRRAAWSKLFVASRDWLRTHRRTLANQAMFTDVNLYLSNRAVAAIDPPNALPEDAARAYLYQAAGLTPWLGPDGGDGRPTEPLGDDFLQVTDKGLTRELGYVGGYGEVGTCGVMDLYDATRDHGGEGDPKLKAQVVKVARARQPFRYPAPGDDGRPAMRLETGVGWRDAHFPGPVLYTQPAGGDQSVLRIAAATLDPHLVGAAQQMFADDQFFASVADHLADKRFRATVGLLDLPDEYALLKAQPPSPHRLPMSADQPDFVSADEEAGVVAIKRGPEVLYISLYWRAGFGVNGLARVHLLTPNYQQVAVVREEVVVDASGQAFKRPDWVNFGFAKGGTHIKYPRDLHQAMAGEELPIAKMPPGVAFKPGDWNPLAGRAQFYALRFGPYLIAMNTTTDRTFPVTVPAGATNVTDRGNPVAAGKLDVAPRSTVVLHVK